MEYEESRDIRYCMMEDMEVWYDWYLYRMEEKEDFLIF